MLPVLVYDGDCGFCTASAQWGQRRLNLARVQSWQQLDLESLGLTEQQCSEAVQWVAVDGQRFAGSAAIAHALAEGGRPYRLAAKLLALPGLRGGSERLYRLIARHRHRLPGSTDACRLG